jgi:hypothetical protein
MDLNMKKEFLYQSIIDIQETIRAIDTKLGFLLIFLAIPLTNLGKIYTYIDRLYAQLNTIGWIIVYSLLIFSFVAAWIMAFLSSIMAISGIDNPASHIITEVDDFLGSFYNKGLFTFNIVDLLKNREKTRSSKSLNIIIQDLPHTEEKIIKELTFEQMKLAYIRDIKIHRQSWAFRLTIFWLFLGFIIWSLKWVG